MRNILVAGPYSRKELEEVSALANLRWLSDMGPSELDLFLPMVDCLFVHFWPKELDSSRLRMMRRLSFVQTGLAGVNHIPFKDLPAEVVVSSNAGGYSDEVSEFAWGLLLVAAKRIVTAQLRATEEGYGASPLELGKEVVVLKGKTMGVLGHGGIGGSVARIGKAFGMDVLGLSTRGTPKEGVESLVGSLGLERILRESDALVIALPLTKSTRGMMGKKQLSLMKKGAILVNVARGEIIDQQALYEHLIHNPEFTYATDVWWSTDGKERYPPELPFFDLPNFIGTPHVAGPSAVTGGGPLANARANVLRYLSGERVLNVVDRADYEQT